MAVAQDLITLKEASQWASNFLCRDINESNISYLIQYGKVKKYGNDGSTLIKVNDLKNYYSVNGKREIDWKKNLEVI